MTKEEFRKIENMTFQEFCSFLETSPSMLLAKNLYCRKCQLYHSKDLLRQVSVTTKGEY